MSYRAPSFLAPHFEGLPPPPDIPRRLAPAVVTRLGQFPAVALLGPRQAGKTTLAKAISKTRPSLYLDLQLPSDRQRLAEAEHYLLGQRDKLVILDEVQLVPELFQTLRGLIDRRRQDGDANGAYLLLGSATGELLRQSESLAGRISYLELGPIDGLEIDPARQDILWNRGGFPRSLRATDDSESLLWRQDFLRTYLQHDLAELELRLPAETLRRFWTMLAHRQGQPFNAAQFARALDVSGKTATRYLDVLADLFMVRKLVPYFANVEKRLVKSPKVYVRDSGLVHALLGLVDLHAVLGHPVAGYSWEGLVVENLIAACPWPTVPSFYRTSAGAEINLVLELPGRLLWVIEIKRSLSTGPKRGFYNALQDVKPERAFIVHAAQDRYLIRRDIEAIGLRELATLLSEMR